MFRTIAAAALGILIVAAPLYADEPTGAPVLESIPLRVRLAVPPPATRGAVLPALYVGYGALQAFDGFSTIYGVGHGAVEANPQMTGAAATPASVWALKAATTGAAIGVAEKLWRQNRRTQAIVLMVVANGVMATVAAHNAAVLRRR